MAKVTMLLLMCAFGFLFRACEGIEDAGYPPMPPGPPRTLPQYDASEYPGYYPVFQAGECDADDLGNPMLTINTKKACYSCFRIPSFTTNPKTGTIHAFAEARRRDLHTYHWGYTIDASGWCPDIPDTHVAYKRSTNGGKSWSSIKILFKNPSILQKNPSPVFDDTTGKLIVLYTQGYPRSVAMQIDSTDDGVTWSAPKTAVPSNGTSPIVLGTNGARGYVAVNGSAVRLLFPSQLGTLYSDDHGATWSTGTYPVGFPGCMGEAAFARCTLGAACNGRSWVVMNRCSPARGATTPPKCVAFSEDGVHWDPAIETNLTQFNKGGYAPGLVGVPGGLVFSVNGWKSPPSGLQVQGMGDGAGGDLLYAEDGKDWKFLRRLWPFTFGYSVLGELEVDATGAATKYGAMIEAGGILTGDSYILFMNFTSPSSAPPTKPERTTQEKRVIV